MNLTLQPLWQPANMTDALSEKFTREINQKYQLQLRSFHDLYDWSVKHPEKFWQECVKAVGIKLAGEYSRVITPGAFMHQAQWFKGSKLNFAEHLLKGENDKQAIIFWGEDKVKRSLTYAELRGQVSKAQKLLSQLGINHDSRVVALLPNIPEAIVLMLASTSLGATWSSCSPDFASPAVLDRFAQLTPDLFICCDQYLYRQQVVDCRPKALEICAALNTKHNILVSYFADEQIELSGFINLRQELHAISAQALNFPLFTFNHPLYIMFSSGSTGKPKCIIHSAGGTLLEQLKELKLHFDLSTSDTFFYQTSTSWMMWNWLVAGLACGATVALYDGFPLLEDGKILWRMAQEESITLFGTNAKYLALIEKSNLIPQQDFDLSPLRAVLSTGSTLMPESYDYVYQKIKADVLLSSISGGTDILGCFALGSSTLPVWRGELQTRSLGLKVEVWSEQAQALTQQKGELVCTNSFPSMPLGFWGDDAEQSLYVKTYFSHFPGVWRQGDFVELTNHNGMIFYGRSDSTLKPGGVRIGSAEITRPVESLSQVVESVVVAQEWQSDVRIILFVKLKEGLEITPELRQQILATIKSQASSYHLPKKILAVADIPRTKNAKIAESAIREVIHGREPNNLDALANPEALNYFRGREELHEA